jgi:beta-N-acetylhexosaminidase
MRLQPPELRIVTSPKFVESSASLTLSSLRFAPFNLDDCAFEWVQTTLTQLQQRQRLAQLFNVMLRPQSPEEFAAVAAEQPGGFTLMLFDGLEAGLARARALRAASPVPPLVSADVEGGAISLAGCTPMNNQLGMAAMDSVPLYEQALGVMAAEAKALGINWSFTPVIDINAEFRSAIVATRSFGSDKARIETLARAHVRVMQGQGVAATAKHWPGEGFDARDQHLVTTINPLSMADWHARFGRLYKALIKDGVMSIMSAHIALPAYAQAHGVSGLETCRPASVSRLLNTQLLRGELGFNGLITSDATTMGGLASWGPRGQVAPEVIENGCDMVLFTRDLKADLDNMEAALRDGRLSQARVEEALIRVLGLKAALGLHRQTHGGVSVAQASETLKTPGHLAVADAVAAASPTLVKDVQGLLPLSAQRHRRVVLVTEPHRSGFAHLPPPALIFGELLSGRGFEVSHYSADQPPAVGKTDLVIFLLAQESLLNKSNIYLDWAALLGPVERAMARDWHEIPTLLVSFGQPYYLYDAPRMPCVVNAYTATEPVQRAVVRKLLGEEPFTGVSPVDAFCGLPDARY